MEGKNPSGGVAVTSIVIFMTLVIPEVSYLNFYLETISDLESCKNIKRNPVNPLPRFTLCQYFAIWVF